MASAGAAAAAAAAANETKTAEMDTKTKKKPAFLAPVSGQLLLAYRLHESIIVPQAGETSRYGNLQNPTCAMPNTLTAQQSANAIFDVAAKSKVPTEVIDIGYAPSTTLAALFMIPGVEKFIKAFSYSWTENLLYYAKTVNRLAPVFNELGPENDALTRKRGSFIGIKLARMVQELIPDEKEVLGAITNFREQFTKYVDPEDNTFCQVLGKFYTERYFRESPKFWKQVMARAAVMSIFEEWPTNQIYLDPAPEGIATRVSEAKYKVPVRTESDLKREEDLRGFPAMPLYGMFKTSPFGKCTILNMTLYHNPNLSLMHAILEGLFIRLIATVHVFFKPTVIVFNDFVGRIFPELKRSENEHKTLELRPDDPRRAELLVVAEAFGLERLKLACLSRKEEAPIETWSEIRRAILTHKFRSNAAPRRVVPAAINENRDGKNPVISIKAQDSKGPIVQTESPLFQACVDWMFVACDVSYMEREALVTSLRTTVWKEDVAVHANGMQTVRLSPERMALDPMQWELYMKTPVEAETAAVRRFDRAGPGWVIGAPRLSKERFIPMIRQRFHSADEHAKSLLAASETFFEQKLSPQPDAEWVRNLIVSQPSIRNTVHPWAVLDHMTGVDRYKKVIIVNDWLKTWEAATYGQAAHQHISIPQLACRTPAQTAVFKAAFAATLRESFDLKTIEAERKQALPIIVNLNWGTRSKDEKTGDMAWSDINAACDALGALLPELVVHNVGFESIVLCILLPGRKVNDYSSGKDAIGFKTGNPKFEDVKGREQRAISYRAKNIIKETRSILTEATLHITALNTLRERKVNADDYFWIAHLPITPTLAALYIKIWPGIDKPSPRNLKLEWENFQKVVKNAHHDAARKYSWWLPETQRVDHQARKKERKAFRKAMREAAQNQRDDIQNDTAAAEADWMNVDGKADGVYAGDGYQQQYYANGSYVGYEDQQQYYPADDDGTYAAGDYDDDQQQNVFPDAAEAKAS
jgi:hypothetical protein